MGREASGVDVIKPSNAEEHARQYRGISGPAMPSPRFRFFRFTVAGPAAAAAYSHPRITTLPSHALWWKWWFPRICLIERALLTHGLNLIFALGYQRSAHLRVGSPLHLELG
jgi:hypothetical protein